jgi:hypothetical protein
LIARAHQVAPRPADAELGAERTAIVNDDQALLGQKASLSPADYQQRVAQLKQRYAELDRTRALRDAQLNMTRRDAIAQMNTVRGPKTGAAVDCAMASPARNNAATEPASTPR